MVSSSTRRPHEFEHSLIDGALAHGEGGGHGAGGVACGGAGVELGADRGVQCLCVDFPLGCALDDQAYLAPAALGIAIG